MYMKRIAKVGLIVGLVMGGSYVFCYLEFRSTHLTNLGMGGKCIDFSRDESALNFYGPLIDFEMKFRDTQVCVPGGMP